MRTPLVLYVGNISPNQTSGHRKCTLERLGCRVTSIDPRQLLPSFFRNLLVSKLEFHSGYVWSQAWIFSRISQTLATLANRTFDIVWVNGGETLGPNVIKRLSSLAPHVILYNNDNPFSGRDGRRFDTLRKALPAYTLCVGRRKNCEGYLSFGARRVMAIWMSYDEIAHEPCSPDYCLPEDLSSDVSFAGTWMPERGPFMARLIELGIPLKIWGGRWKKSPQWPIIRNCWQGPALVGRDYVSAIAGAKISLGLLSKGNRDLHTRRSVEIPYAGGLLCAERTPEHQMLYAEGEEAVFWKDADECAAVCKTLLADPVRREQIRLAGMKRIRELKLGNQDVCQEILDLALTGQTQIVRPFYTV